jgi:hypothetical protein
MQWTNPPSAGEERKKLRHELKAMREEVRGTNHTGLYIAVGLLLFVVFLVMVIF